jgi:hypothetical protein
MHPLTITYNDRTLFHMLRHFETINEGAIACLFNRGYQQKEIDAAFQIPSSRFHAGFAQDLKMLQHQCSLGQIISQETIGSYLHVQLKFDPNVYPQGIGKLGVVPIDDLSKLGTSTVFVKENRGKLLQHAIVDELPHTWEMILVLKPQKSYQLLITAFPGTGALPIPHTKMKDADFKASTHFWENHVFLELA